MPIVLRPEDVRGEVSFEGVSFAYDDDKQTLSDITFTAHPGQLVALVGHSGSGKTTLTYLIPRLYDADSGTVRIDGHEIKRLPLATLGQAIGVVTQETYLVHDTIRENLRYGRPDATDEQLIAAAQAAAIHEHIASLPAGYDNRGRGAGLQALRRGKTAHCHCACDPQEPADSDLRRSHQRLRYPERAPDPRTPSPASLRAARRLPSPTASRPSLRQISFS